IRHGRLPGLAIESALQPAVADADGHLLVTGLGNSARARLRIRTESIDDPYLLPSADGVVFKPRAGRIALGEYPLRISGEVMIKIQLTDADGHSRGVSALGVMLVAANGEVVKAGRSEYDGTVLLEGLAPGDYQLRLDPSQSERLHISLVGAIAVRIPAAGGYAGEVVAPITISRADSEQIIK
ncbi:MAG: hypothetical protein WCO67_24990, partial [Betaproteobacteria bacterium]